MDDGIGRHLRSGPEIRELFGEPKVSLLLQANSLTSGIFDSTFRVRAWQHPWRRPPFCSFEDECPARSMTFPRG